ncbi:MAG: acyl-CoA dehydrogenase family protein [Pseudomonadales bacterium]|nr:acyl-CoA dehydrogenase family protein [Pseudomonadales bacterium]
MQANLDLSQLTISDKAKPLLEAANRFISAVVTPRTRAFKDADAEHGDRWSLSPRQVSTVDELKAEARRRGLWNLFLPDSNTGKGLSNLDYAYIATELGKNPIGAGSD